MKKYRININSNYIIFDETEYLMFVSFLYRLKKEINWFKKNQKEPFFISSANYSFLNAYVDIINVRISLKSEVYTFDYEEFDKMFCFVKQDLMKKFPIEGLDYNTIDGVYMEYMLAVDLPYLYRVKEDEIYVKDLLVFSKDFALNPLSKSEHLKFLKKEIILDFQTRTNLHNQTHEERFNDVLVSCSFTNYGDNGQYIIVYNDENIIRDGAHRAAVLYSINPSAKIKILRLFFKKNYYTFENYFKLSSKKNYFESLLRSSQNTRYLKVNTFNTNIIRSDYIRNDENDVNKLREIGVQTIIDLRNFLNHEPPLYLIDAFDWHNIGVVHTNKKTEEETRIFVKNITEYYSFILSQKNAFYNAFDCIKNSNGKILINCMLGRDRTGIFAMLCGMILGSSNEELIEEYLLTDEIYCQLEINKTLELDFFKSRDGFLKFLYWFKNKYGDVYNFLYDLGFNENDLLLIINRIRGDVA